MIIYLLAPQWHKNSEVRKSRRQMAIQKTAELNAAGHTVGCAVPYDPPSIQVCDVLYVYRLAGWQWDMDVKKSIELAKKFNKPIEYID